MLEGAAAGGCYLRRFQEPGHAAQRPQFGHQRPVVLLGPRDPGRERGRPPPLAPEQQPPHVAAPERVPLSQQGQLGAVGRAVRAQLGGPERQLVSSSAASPRVQAATVARASAARVGLQGPGEPGDAAGQRRLAAAGPGGALEVPGRVEHRAPAQRDPAGQQVRLHGLAGPGRLEAGGDLLGVPQQPDGTLAPRVPGLSEDEASARRPGVPALRPEQPLRLAGSRAGGAGVARGEGGSGGGEDEFRPLIGDPGAGRRPAERGVRFSCRFCGEPGGQQGPAAVEGQVGIGYAQRV